MNVWNVRHASLVHSIAYETPGYPYVSLGEASVLCASPDKSTVAVGYSDGDIRLLNYIQGTVITTLKGHRSGIASICFDELGSTLVSGGKDRYG